jgi:capsular exopolysaccharide synthesis family protein
MSSEVADAVIKKLKLAELPYFGTSDDASLAFLRLLSVSSDPKKNTLTIGFNFTDPQNAADIANEVAAVYVRLASERGEGTKQSTLEVLKKELRIAQAKQAEIRARIVEFTARYPELTREEEIKTQITSLEAEILPVNNKIHEVRGVLEELADYRKRGEPLDTHPYIKNHPRVASKLDRIREIEFSIVELSQEYREMHPEITKAKQTIDAFRTILREEEEKAIEDLQDELRFLPRKRDKINGDIQKLKDSLSSRSPEKEKYEDDSNEFAVVSARVRSLKQRISDLLLEGALSEATSDVEILSSAVPSGSPIKGDVQKSFLQALPFCVISSLGLFFLKHYFSKSIQRPEDVYRYLRRPLVGQISRLEKIKDYTEPDLSDERGESPLSSMIGLISANCDFLVGKEKDYSIMVTSAVPGEGKTFLTYHLARAFAAKGKKTVLVDADFCRANLTQHFSGLGIRPAKSLDAYLTGKTDSKDLIISTFDPMLDFIGCGYGRRSAPHAFMSPQIKDLIGRLKTSYDIVLFDTPPVLPVNDAVALSPLLNLRLFVIQTGRTSQKDIHHALAKIDPTHQALIGVVLNQVPYFGREYDYYGSYKKK